MLRPEDVDNTINLFLPAEYVAALEIRTQETHGVSFADWGQENPDQIVRAFMPDRERPVETERIIHRRHRADGPQTLDPAELGQDAVDSATADITEDVFDPLTAIFGVRLFMVPDHLDTSRIGVDEIIAASSLIFETVVTPPDLAF